jgi:hypothetical protein
MRSLFIIFWISISLEAISQDSLVLLSEIKYSSDFEREAFQNFLVKKNKDILLRLFLSVGSMDQVKYKSVEDRFLSLVGSIKESGLEKKKPDKKIKFVYDQVHNPLLKKYELENKFHDIFTSGNYNCVSATALYSLVFDKLDIPYEIKEEPTHVYLLGYPNSQNILVETTSPLHGYLTFNQDFKTNYITSLQKQKVIGSDEMDRSSISKMKKYRSPI